MGSDNYDHLVHIDETARKLVIHRVYPDGHVELYSHVDLPPPAGTRAAEPLDAFCRTLGENLLFDSASARRLLAL